MIAYTFCIDSMIWGYHEYQSIWDNPLADGDLLCEWEMGNSHAPQAMANKRWLMVPQLQLLGTCLRNTFQSICLIFTWDSVDV